MKPLTLRKIVGTLLKIGAALYFWLVTGCTKQMEKPHSLVNIEWSGTLFVDTVATLYLSFGCPGHKEIKNFKHVVSYNNGLPPEIAGSWRDAEAGKYETLREMTDTIGPYKFVQYTFHYEIPIDTVYKN